MRREGEGEFNGSGYICNASKRAQLMYSGVAWSPPIYSSRSLYLKVHKTNGVPVKVSPAFHFHLMDSVKLRAWMSANHYDTAGCIP